MADATQHAHFEPERHLRSLDQTSRSDENFHLCTNAMASCRSSKSYTRASSGPVRSPLMKSLPLRRRHLKCSSPPLWSITNLLLIIMAMLLPSQGAFIDFENCLDPSIANSNPLQLQFIPLFVNANFDETKPSHNLQLTIYGNVSGRTVDAAYPPPDSPHWNNSQETLGKIIDTDPTTNTRSTLFQLYEVLTYTAFDAPAAPFCTSLVNGSCPLSPSFFADPSDPYAFPAFQISHDFFSSYAFSTISSTLRVRTGAASARDLACVSANITPNIGATVSGVLRYIPVVVLVFVALATVSAAIFSPWGSTDPFRWTSNYGRDEDLIRLVTPGFGDCLQYIQFIVLLGSLSLSYPGYYQPVVSKAAWSALMFNESFVSGNDGTRSLVDGIYVTNGTYGLSRMGQLVGMSTTEDIWVGMVVWTLVILAAVIILCQLGFFTRWAIKKIASSPEEDLRSKNWPFTGGNLVRIVCIYFLLPIVALSMFQLVIAASSPGYVTAMAVVLLVLILAFAAWILRLIFAAKQRSRLFDDLQTVLLYGPLYNTYADDAAPFALVPAMLTFIRGVAIGAIQPSGIAQVVVLAICEVILILTLHAFRPFHSPTSMNFYHTFFASMRLTVVLLSVAFIPKLGVTEAPKGWIGYVILLLHAIVLIFGFFLNSVQTLIEVGARIAGAGNDQGTGAAARGGLSKVFGMRQLSRRARRPGFRSSMHSDAAILAHDDSDVKSVQFGDRARSLSASSAILLNQQRSTPESANLERLSTGLSGGFPGGEPDMENGRARSFSFLPDAVGASRRPDLAIRTGEVADPYYRPPRQRRPTGDLVTPGARSRGSMTPGEIVKGIEDSPEQFDPTGRPISFSPPQGAPTPAYMRTRDDSDASLNDPRRGNVDYAVREVDFYYGVRGPALSNQPTRKLKTGPADPVGPVSSATGWFRNMFGRKTKESGKGFEVVRSSRAPPAGFEDETPTQPFTEPYHDTPQAAVDGTLPGQRTRSTDDDRQRKHGDDGSSGSDSDIEEPSPLNSEDESWDSQNPHRVSDIPPSLGPIDAGGNIELPSRYASKTSRRSRKSAKGEQGGDVPSVPRRSSRRASKHELDAPKLPRLDKIDSSPVRQGSGSGTEGSRPRVPFSTSSNPGDRISAMSLGAESMLSVGDDASGEPSNRANSSRDGSYVQSGLRDDRPTNMGYVNQFRASDSIQTATLDPRAHAGSAAELVEGSPRRSRETDSARP